MPTLPPRAVELLRTPPRIVEQREGNQYITASWGSPYPPSEEARYRGQGSDSEPSEGSPIHRLELETPFLRPAPYLAAPSAEHHPSSLAAILVNRARRPGLARGLTEDWIRQHTAADENVEPRHWFSDGSDSEHSSLSGSNPGDELAWLEDKDHTTPKAKLGRAAPVQHPRARSSTETLKQSTVDLLRQPGRVAMASPENEGSAPLLMSNGAPDERQTTPDGTTGSRVGSAELEKAQMKRPVTPTRPEPTKASAPTPRIKKRVPWKGKNIMVLLPRDDQRGQRGHRPIPLKEHEVANMFREWEELGYNIRGFDLNEPTAYSALPTEHYSKSRDEWPDAEDLRKEWSERRFNVVLPDILGKLVMASSSFALLCSQKCSLETVCRRIE